MGNHAPVIMVHGLFGFGPRDLAVSRMLCNFVGRRFKTCPYPPNYTISAIAPGTSGRFPIGALPSRSNPLSQDTSRR